MSDDGCPKEFRVLHRLAGVTTGSCERMDVHALFLEDLTPVVFSRLSVFSGAERDSPMGPPRDYSPLRRLASGAATLVADDDGSSFAAPGVPGAAVMSVPTDPQSLKIRQDPQTGAISYDSK